MQVGSRDPTCIPATAAVSLGPTLPVPSPHAPRGTSLSKWSLSRRAREREEKGVPSLYTLRHEGPDRGVDASHDLRVYRFPSSMRRGRRGGRSYADRVLLSTKPASLFFYPENN